MIVTFLQGHIKLRGGIPKLINIRYVYQYIRLRGSYIFQDWVIVVMKQENKTDAFKIPFWCAYLSTWKEKPIWAKSQPFLLNARFMSRIFSWKQTKDQDNVMFWSERWKARTEILWKCQGHSESLRFYNLPAAEVRLCCQYCRGPF